MKTSTNILALAKDYNSLQKKNIVYFFEVTDLFIENTKSFGQNVNKLNAKAKRFFKLLPVTRA